MADTYDLEDYWEAIRPGWKREKPKVVANKWYSLPSPLQTNILDVYSYKGCSSTTHTFITWNGVG